MDLWYHDEELGDEDDDTPSLLVLEKSDPIVIDAIVHERGCPPPPSDDTKSASAHTTDSVHGSSCSSAEDYFSDLSPVTGDDDTPCEGGGDKRRRTR